MKTHAVYVLIISGLIVALIFLYNQIRELKSINEMRESVIAEKNAEIQYWINKDGKTVSEKQAAELRVRDIEQMYPKIYASIQKDFDIKIKDLKAYIENEFAAQGSGAGSVTHNHYYDSAGRKIRFRDFSMDDGFLKFETRLFDSLSTSLYKYTYTDTAKTAFHVKKKWLFGKEELFASTIFSNPNAKIQSTTNILVNNYRDKRWVISVGIYVDPILRNYGLGINAGYALIKF